MTEKKLKIEEDKVFLEVNPPMDIVINRQLELHITSTKDEIIVDGYIYRTDEELEDEEHDMDEDYIDTISFSKK